MMAPDPLTRVARPRLSQVLPNARRITRTQLAITLLRPWPAVLVYVVAATHGWWPVAVVAVAFVFATDVVVIHDLFHRNLGFSPLTNDVLTTIYGCLLLNSGHALAASHRRHHRVYPADGDPEAYVDGWPVWRVVLEGPRYRFRVWRWALACSDTARPLLCAEMTVWLAAWTAAIVLGPTHPALWAYVILAEIGSWTFPLISVTGVHDKHASGPLQQTRTLRAPLIGPLLLGMQYHLEHHLYPRVPACRLPELAAALDHWLTENDAAIWRQPRATTTTATPPVMPLVRVRQHRRRDESTEEALLDTIRAEPEAELRQRPLNVLVRSALISEEVAARTKQTEPKAPRHEMP